MADNERAPWQTPGIEPLTEAGTRPDDVSARIRNGLEDSVSDA